MKAPSAQKAHWTLPKVKHRLNAMTFLFYAGRNMWSWPSRLVAFQLAENLKNTGNVKVEMDLLYTTPSHHVDLVDCILLATEECPHQFGYFRLGHDADCGRFMNCADGRGYTFDCPDGLAFNQETYRCDWPDQVHDCNAEKFLGFTCPTELKVAGLGQSEIRFYRSPNMTGWPAIAKEAIAPTSAFMADQALHLSLVLGEQRDSTATSSHEFRGAVPSASKAVYDSIASNKKYFIVKLNLKTVVINDNDDDDKSLKPLKQFDEVVETVEARVAYKNAKFTLHKHGFKRRRLILDALRKFGQEIWNKKAALNNGELIPSRRPNSKFGNDGSRFKICPEALNENTNPQLFGSLSKEAKEVVRCYSRMKVRGKKNRTVPVLLNQSMEAKLNLLISHREEAGIPQKNKYLFAMPPSPIEDIVVVKAGVTLKKFAELSGAENPSRINGTNLRKQLATMCVSLKLDDSEVADVADFMGHAELVHRNSYRQNTIDRQVVKMSQWLEAALGNVTCIGTERKLNNECQQKASDLLNQLQAALCDEDCPDECSVPTQYCEGSSNVTKY
ncbi:Protein obstructor-E [Pseudolycoriella hygida]|uniref:Protein obstructor-E n=1 Tax=Pseudolycoriella hygida TaxID=35572 RepID=A0A9Q0S243_9DIPT|nr:Protein obstructor-E [Pseudolycoriella hygida]